MWLAVWRSDAEITLMRSASTLMLLTRSRTSRSMPSPGCLHSPCVEAYTGQKDATRAEKARNGPRPDLPGGRTGLGTGVRRSEAVGAPGVGSLVLGVGRVDTQAGLLEQERHL